MSINVNWLESYAPAEAERGKFIPIDTTSLNTTLGYPLTGRGKFALLTCDIGTTTSPGASSANPMYVVQSGTNAVLVSTLSFSNSLSTISYATNISFLEIYNNDASNKMYVSFEPLTTVISLTSRGLPVSGQGYYSIDKTTSQVVVGSNLSVSDVRVFGHYVR
jgi:hypothetical protein